MSRKMTNRVVVGFLVTGLASVVFGYGVFVVALAVLEKSVGYLGALTTSFLIVNAINFLITRRYVFRTDDAYFRQGSRYFSVQIALFLANGLGLFGAVEILRMDPLVAQLLMIPPLGLLSLFAHSSYTFKAGEAPERQ
jgi:putative flippase GtrA